MLRACVCALALALCAGPVYAQSQAANGSIEGTVTDTSGGVLPGVTVTITNTDTGNERLSITNADGLFRALLLPLGQYRVVAEMQGFKRYEQTGISLQAGQAATLSILLSVGAVSETVTITSEVPVAQPGKIDLGRTIGEVEIRNLPLPSRNPYNFAFLQANVTGYENTEFGVPRINANGTQMHTNYQIDGNTNTEKDRAGLRLLPISEVLVREVKVVTNGFAPEFGQTTGMVYNAITQSGTNDFHGSASYRFKRNPMSSRTFFLAPTARKPDTEADDFTAVLGGPVARDKAHFFGAYEFVDRSLITGNQIVTVTPANASGLGISLPESGVIPAHQKVNFGFGKVDYQLGPSTLVTGRYFLFKNFSLSNIGGGLTTPDRATDFTDRMDSAAVQAVTTIGDSRLNELRVQFARRHQFRTANETAVAGPAITISGVALFGGPRIGDDNSVGFDFSQKIWQVIDNYTWVKGAHALKGGADLQFIGDDRVAPEMFQYTFASADAYLAARNGTNRLGYTSLQQNFGNLAASYQSRFYGFFVQDDWQLAPRIKLLYGLRYDVFDVPEARPYALNPYSNDFKIDKNNWGPRLGLAWTLDSSGQTVVRASVGKMFEPPLLNFYDNAILSNGDPLSFNVNIAGSVANAPAFPASLATVPAGFTLPRQSIGAVDPDFETQSAWLSNVQIERALDENTSIAVGYVNAVGRNLPVQMDVNLIPTGRTLADGRPIYSNTVSAQTRIDPTFDHINMFQSIGESLYNALTVTMARRMRQGWQTQVTYTLARGTDNAPLPTYVVGSADDRVSDPSNLDREKGVTPFNQTHTLTASGVIAPQVSGSGLAAMLMNNNQLSLIFQANSGLPFNIRSNQDLNADGIANNDRPLGIERNAGRLGNVYNLDFRYSRFIPLGVPRAELFVEAKNLFDRANIAGVNRTVVTDAVGNPAAPISTVGSEYPNAGKSGYDQRIFQVGFKVAF
jgi:hypothetical protein